MKRKKMKVLVFLSLFFSALPAFAETTLAGVMFGGVPITYDTKPNSAVCYLFNTSSSLVYIKTKFMTAENGGGSYKLTYDSCSTGVIQPGKICAFQATLGGSNGGVGCVVTLYSSDGVSDRSVRGELEVRDFYAKVLSNIPLTK